MPRLTQLTGTCVGGASGRVEDELLGLDRLRGPDRLCGLGLRGLRGQLWCYSGFGDGLGRLLGARGRPDIGCAFSPAVRQTSVQLPFGAFDRAIDLVPERVTLRLDAPGVAWMVVGVVGRAMTRLVGGVSVARAVVAWLVVGVVGCAVAGLVAGIGVARLVYAGAAVVLGGRLL